MLRTLDPGCGGGTGQELAVCRLPPPHFGRPLGKYAPSPGILSKALAAGDGGLVDGAAVGDLQGNVPHPVPVPRERGHGLGEGGQGRVRGILRQGGQDHTPPPKRGSGGLQGGGLSVAPHGGGMVLIK